MEHNAQLLQHSMHDNTPRVRDTELMKRLKNADASAAYGEEVGRATDDPKLWAIRLDNRTRGQQRISDAFSALMRDLGLPLFSTSHALAGRCRYKFVAMPEDGVYLVAVVPSMTANAV